MNILFSFLIIIGIAVSEGLSVVYYVSPTEPQSSCSGNSSCPPGQLCRTMDYLVENSNKFFSPDHINVTLIFMCGVHNYTKDLTVQNLHSFVMKGAAESKENVIIDHQFGAQLGKPNCTIIQLFNISFVNITTLTMKCPSINLKGSLITVKSSNLYGYTGTKESLSFINITGRGSQALLDNCTFKENCFVVSNFSDGVIVSNSTFQSYRHRVNSIIAAYSSVVTIAGNVNFTDSVTGIYPTYSSGTAVFLRTTHPELKSSLNITTGATVYFVNLTSNNHGGAVYGENGVINIGVKAKVVFMQNVGAYHGGAVTLQNGTIFVGVESNVVFAYNLVYVYGGGAIWLENGALNIDTDASLRFSHNSVDQSGGAVYLSNSTIHVETDTVHFYNNSGESGGAMCLVYGSMYINSKGTVTFTMNTAKYQGGAIYIESGAPSPIIVDNSAKLLLFNNSAYQGGALYVIPLTFTIQVGYQSSVQFINNTASDVGGAVYSEIQTAAPCLFMVTDYSAELSFIRNYANRNIGHHMYGTSVRDYKCNERLNTKWTNKQGKPYCWNPNDNAHEHINISFHPGLNETLSPVSSTPWRVCLCDSTGKPQCANFSQIFTTISVYRGETFTLSACVVGYDFGTTVGIVHAGFLYSNQSSQLEKSQYNQPVSNSERCSTLNYTVHSKHDDELLLLQTSLLTLSTYETARFKNSIGSEVNDYISHNPFGCVDKHILKTPVFINVTLLPGCPPGLAKR